MSSSKKNRVAITGNIGSGKTTFVGFIKELCYPVIFADDISKDILQNNSNVRKQIISKFGTESFLNGKINSGYLADKIFSDPLKLKIINSILHPEVRKKIEVLSNEFFKKNNIVFVEAALIYESRMEKMFDIIVLITADLETRIERKKSAKKLDKIEFLKREKNQISEDVKMKKAHYVFANDGSKNNLKQKAHLLIKLLKVN